MRTNNLHNTKNTGFKTPNDYFETFDDRLFEKLEKDNPTLENIEDTGFTTPDDYFETLEDSIFEKLNDDNKPFIAINRKRKLYYISGIAASILLLLAIFINKPNNSEALSTEMVETYFTDADLDTYELAELLSDADLLDENFTITETNYNEDSLEEYLLEHSDIESILE